MGTCERQRPRGSGRCQTNIETGQQGGRGASVRLGKHTTQNNGNQALAKSKCHNLVRGEDLTLRIQDASRKSVTSAPPPRPPPRTRGWCRRFAQSFTPATTRARTTNAQPSLPLLPPRLLRCSRSTTPLCGGSFELSDRGPTACLDRVQNHTLQAPCFAAKS